MEKISSFTVDHRKIEVGVYISRIDGDITTYDLRMRKPNSDNLLSNQAIHSIEHMFATFIRNSDLKEDVIYFGPMGCQTGFYLLIRNADNQRVLYEIKNTLKKIIDYTGEVFGASEIECGNYKNLNLESAKKECIEYYKKIINLTEMDMKY